MHTYLSGYGNQDMYEGCVKGLRAEAYLDWEWQCEQTFQIHCLRGQERPMSCIGLVDSRGKAPNTPRKYPPIDMGRIEEADEVQVVAYLGLPRLQRTYPYTIEGCKVTEGVRVSFTRGKYYKEVWCDRVPMASCHLSLGANWFTEHRVPNERNGYKCVVDNWGTPLFPLPKVTNERQKIERSKGKQGGNIRVQKGEVERSEVRGLPKSQSNLFVYPSLCKNSSVGTSVMNGVTQVPAKEPTVEGVMDALMDVRTSKVKQIFLAGVKGMTSSFEPICSHTHENTLEEVDLQNTFLYYLFTTDDAHAAEWSMLLGGTSGHLINGGALDPSSWKTFLFDPGSELSWGIHVGMPGQNGRHKDSFLDPLSISYPEHDIVDCASYGGRRYLPRKGEGVIVVYTYWYDLVLWTSYYFDPGECMKVFELVEVSSFRWYYHVVEKNNHRPCSPFVGLIAMTIEDVWLFLEFESPRANENLIDLMLCNPFPFDPSIVFKCAECSSNNVKFVYRWHGDEIVIANANPHDMRILFLFAFPMVLQGMDSRTNPFQEGENDVIQITSRLFIHELQCSDGVSVHKDGGCWA
ncbi:hypothetical protein KY285_026414 [Solanum tuberosum]|nr:hypothetical protein KY285_026414 [Solanum tuberosum]